jgi:hypothetical protein
MENNPETPTLDNRYNIFAGKAAGSKISLPYNVEVYTKKVSRYLYHSKPRK